MSRFYILSEFCDRHGISITKINNVDFEFSKGEDKYIFSSYKVLTRPDVVKDELKKEFWH